MSPWDRIVVSYKGNDDDRRDIGTSGEVRFRLKSEYDDTAVTSGSVSVNGTSATWDSTNSWWELTTGVVNTVEKRSYVVTAVNWDTYGITALNNGVLTNATSIIWDRLNVTQIEVSDRIV